MQLYIYLLIYLFIIRSSDMRKPDHFITYDDGWRHFLVSNTSGCVILCVLVSLSFHLLCQYKVIKGKFKLFLLFLCGRRVSNWRQFLKLILNTSLIVRVSWQSARFRPLLLIWSSFAYATWFCRFPANDVMLLGLHWDAANTKRKCQISF